MKTKLTIAAFLISSACHAQIPVASDNWTKDDRNAVYEDGMSTVTKNRTLSPEQRESLALCYLDEITKKYTKKEYTAKIDIEVKRITEATLSQCAKNIGVDLAAKKVEVPADQPVKTEVVKAAKKVNELNYTIDDLVGQWKDENSKVSFNADGTYVQKGNGQSSVGGNYYVNENKNIVMDNSEIYYVDSFDGKNLKYHQLTQTKKLLGLKKKTTSDTFTYVKQE